MIFDIILEPSCDIHLALTPSVFDEIEVKVFSRTWLSSDEVKAFGYDFDLQDVTSQCTFTIFDSPSKVVLKDSGVSGDFKELTNPGNPSVKGVGLGEAFLLVSFLDGATTNWIVSKITIHNKIESWWFGAKKLSLPLHDGIPHSQVPIYAMFDANASGIGTIEEITGQGFVDLQPHNANSLNFFNVDFYGRIWIINIGASQTNLFVHGQAIDASLVSTGSNLLPIKPMEIQGATINRCSHTMVGTKNHIDNHNILLVGEGFSSPSEFRELIENRFFPKFFNTNGRFSPFNYLAKNLNFWYLLPVGGNWEEGITYPYHVRPVHFSNLNLPTGVTIPDSAAMLFQMVDSQLGLTFGGRKGDKKSSLGTLPINYNEAETYWQDEGHRIELDKVAGDRRRYSPYLFWQDAIMRYFSGTVDTDGNSRGWLWENNISRGIGKYRAYVKDFGLVGVIIKDHNFRAFNQTNKGFFFSHVSDLSILLTAGAHKVLEGSLIMINTLVWKLNREIPSNPNFVPNGYNSFIDTTGHELGHSFNLGDEYEEHEEHGVHLFTNKKNTWDNLQNYEELVTVAPVYVGGELVLPNHTYSLNADLIKWSKLPRVEFSAVVKQNIFLTEVAADKYEFDLLLQKDDEYHTIDQNTWKEYLSNETNAGDDKRKDMKLFLYLPGTDNNKQQLRTDPPIIHVLDYKDWQDPVISFEVIKNDFPQDRSANPLMPIITTENYGKEITDVDPPNNATVKITFADTLTEDLKVYDTPVKIVDSLNNKWLVANGAVSNQDVDDYTYYIPKNSFLFYPRIAKKDGIIQIDAVTGDPKELKLVFEVVHDYINANSLPLNYPIGFTGACTFNGDSSPEPPSNAIILNLKSGGDADLYDLERITTGQPDKVLGLYEGGGTYSCGVFRPVGHCKMRTQWLGRDMHFLQGFKSEGAFCQVCKYMIINRINPALHHLVRLDKEYGTIAETSTDE